MLTLIKSVLKSLELYLFLKNKAFYLKLVKDHEKERKSIIQEIEDIRTNGGDADHADLLREQLIRKDRDFEHLSAFYSQFDKRDSNRDK
tara:strand:- start:13133 stop:13399 length:267 start_codon:yes stop_codon:yes gene_type:complete